MTQTLLSVPQRWGTELEQYAVWLSVAVGSIGTVKLRLYQLRRAAGTLEGGPWEQTLESLTAYLASQSWSPGTLRSGGAALRSFYGWAVTSGRVTVDPTLGLPKVSAPPGKPRPASEVVVEAGLRERDERVQLMIRLAAQAGLRCCEIALVHVRDIHEDLVGWSLLVHGKGRKQRVVPLTDGLARALRLYGADGYLFPGQVDGHLSAAYVSKLVSRALPQGSTAHRLRHRFASRAYSGTGDIRAVQELLGHASVATTQIYTAVPDGAMRRGVEAAA